MQQPGLNNQGSIPQSQPIPLQEHQQQQQQQAPPQQQPQQQQPALPPVSSAVGAAAYQPLNHAMAIPPSRPVPAQPMPSSATDGVSKYSDGTGSGSGTPVAAAVGGSSERRSRACEHCRQLKVRCVNDSEDPTQPCQRCLKGKRACIYNMGPRKRTKKADKVAVLEKKVEYLTSQLNQEQSQSPGEEASSQSGVMPPPPPSHSQHPSAINNNNSSSNAPQQQESFNPYSMEYNNSQPTKPGQLKASPNNYSPMSAGSTPAGSSVSRRGAVLRAHQDSKHPSLNGTPEDFLEKPKSRVDTGINMESIREEMLDSWNQIAEKSAKRIQYLDAHSTKKTPTVDNDVVAMGVITLEEAEERFQLYQNVIYKQYPLVHVGEEFTVDKLRRELPILFLAVMCTASMVIEDDSKSEASMIMYNSCCEVVIYETMMVGSKTFELLQCLCLLTFWYNEPEVHHQQKCHLLANLSIAIASDLGINGATVSTKGSLRFEKVVRPQVLVDAKTLECRKLWLGVYCSTNNIALMVRHPMFPMWSSYTEQCCDMIEEADIPDPEKRVAVFARLSHVFEDISQALYNDCGRAVETPPDVDDCRTMYLIRYFETKLRDIWEKSHIPRFEQYYHSLQIYVHQLALYVPFDEALGRAPLSEWSLALGRLKISEQVVSCALWCFSSAIKSLDCFMRYDDLHIATLPRFSFTRLILGVSTLLKLRALSLTNKEFGRYVPVGSEEINRLFKVQDRLKQVSDKYPFSNPALITNFVIKLLLCHFDRQMCQFFGEEEEEVPQAQAQQQQQQQAAQMAPSTSQDTSMQESSSSQQPLNPMRQVQHYDNHAAGSPLEMLSNVAQSHKPGNGADGQLGVAAQQPPVLTNGTTPFAPDQQQQQPDDHYPVWLMGDEFWKDLVPNVEAFTGYDTM